MTLTYELRPEKYTISPIKCPDYITKLALLWLLFETIIIPALKFSLAKSDIKLTVTYDRLTFNLQGYNGLWIIARSFTAFYACFLLIDFLEGVILWLH